MGVKGGEFSNIYGSFNRIDDKGGSETIDGIASTIQGSMNVTTRATGAMLIGTGNTITNSFFKFDDAMGNKLFGATYGSVYYIENKDTLAAGNNLEIYYDAALATRQKVSAGLPLLVQVMNLRVVKITLS